MQLCAEGLGGVGTYFNAILKAEAELGGVTYYTNAEDGYSTTGPAEEIEIELPCFGLDSSLLIPITIEPESTVDLVIWSDPSGLAIFTEDAESLNSYCSASKGKAFCLNYPVAFGTIDAEDPTVERHQFDVKTLDDDGNSYADMMLTTIYNSEDVPFGAVLKQVYTGGDEKKLLHSPQLSFDKVEESSGNISLVYTDENGDDITVISDIPRGEDGSRLSISEFVDEEVEFNSVRLD